MTTIGDANSTGGGRRPLSLFLWTALAVVLATVAYLTGAGMAKRLMVSSMTLPLAIETPTPTPVPTRIVATWLSPDEPIEGMLNEDADDIWRFRGVTGQAVTLDIEHTLPMDWGFVVRFNDFRNMLHFNPPLLEFHFTDKDLDDQYPGDDLDVQLVVHAPEFWGNHLVDLCTFDEDQRRASVEILQRGINVTRDMAPHFRGKPKVVVHPGAASLDQPIKDHKGLYDNLRRSMDELDFDNDVEVLIENLPPHPWYFGGQWLTNAYMDMVEIRDFLDDTGLKICYDTSHHKLYCNWANVDFYEQAAVILPYVSHLHLSDASGIDGEGLQICEGNIDWVKFFEVFGDYHGTMIPEIWRGHQRGGEGFLVAINRLSDAYFKAKK